MAGATLGMAKTYNENSLGQKVAIQSSVEFIQEAIDALDVTSVNIIADFGSAQGTNSIYAMKKIIDYLRETKKVMIEPLVVHNDLPTNDWTLFFQVLIKDNSYNGVASGRSFYEQCLPNNSLSIGYSSSSIHWLSKKPCNISNKCHLNFIENPKEYEAFKHQSYLDYSHFLQHRSCELVPGGILILTISCADNQAKSGLENLHKLLYKCAQLLSLTSDELFDFTIPIHFRTFKECVDEDLFTQYSFELIRTKFVAIESPLYKQWKEEQITLDEFVRLTTSSVRAWAEPILQQVLINNGRAKEDITILLNKFFALYEEETKQQTDMGDFVYNYFYIILKKKSNLI